MSTDKRRKQCSKCKSHRLLKMFMVTNGKRRARCKFCDAELSKQYRKLHPAQYKETKRKANLKRAADPVKREVDRLAATAVYWRRDGLDVKEVLAYIAAHHGACEICRCSIVDHGKRHVDHDHITKRFRGLLCGSCNRALGLFKDDIIRLQAAIKYLRKAARRAK